MSTMFATETTQTKLAIEKRNLQSMPQEREEYLTWAFEYVEDNYDELTVLTGRVFKNHGDERITECISYIMLHNLPNILRTWDPSKGEIEMHVGKAWKWYVWKFIVKCDKHRVRETLGFEAYDSEESVSRIPKLEDIELVQILSDELSPHHWMLLRKRYIEDCSINEICDYACLSRGTVKTRLEQALKHAEEIIRERS